MTPFQKFIVNAYRRAAIVVLLGVLLTAASYFGLVVFYTANRGWVAPVIVSQSNERILAFTSQIFQAKQAADTLDVAVASLTREIEALKSQKSVLDDLIVRSGTALRQQQASDRVLASRLAPLQIQKRLDDVKTQEAVKRSRELAKALDAELAAGLITKVAADTARQAILAAEIGATAALVATVSLDRQVLELERTVSTLSGGKAQSAQALEVLSHVAALRGQLAEIDVLLVKNTADVSNKTREASELRKIITTLSASPYYQVTVSREPLSFAFVPYDNESVAQPGQAVYDCLLQVILCSRVGTVKQVHRDEEKGRHPLFNRDIRGFLVELQLTDRSAAKSRVVFIGRAPLIL